MNIFEPLGEYTQPHEPWPSPDVSLDDMSIVRSDSGPVGYAPGCIPIVAADTRGRADGGGMAPDHAVSPAGGENVMAPPVAPESEVEISETGSKAVVEVREHGEGKIEPPVQPSEQAPLDLGPAFVRTGEGVIRPCDPVTGKVLESGEIPPSLLADEGLRSGYEYLRQYGDRIRLKFLLVAHGDATDLDPKQAGFDLQAEARRLAEASGVLYVETIDSQRGIDSARETYRQATSTPSEQAEQKRRMIQAFANYTQDPFNAALTAHILGTGVTAEPIDFMLDGQRQADRVLTVLDKRSDTDHSNITDMQTFGHYASGLLGFDTYREGYLIGRIGEDMANRFGTLPDTGIDADWILGVAHRHIGSRMGALGVGTAVAGTPRERNPWIRHYGQCLGRGMLTQSDIRQVERWLT